MKVLVTGADGVLGNNLVRELIERNYEVTTLILDGTNPKTLNGLNIQKIYGNILNIRDLKFAMKGIDIVIHCAACTNVWPARADYINQVNIKGTENIIEACLATRIKKIIYVGTANSFGFGDLETPGNEFNAYRSDKYGLDYMDSKMKAQKIILSAVHHKKLPAVVVNPTYMIGPFDSKPSSGAMILALFNKKIPGFPPGGKNFINVKDVAVGIANAIEMGRIGECYILGNKNLTFKEIFNKISDVIGCSVPQVNMPGGLIILYGHINSRMAKIFQFTPSVTKELSIISCDNHFYSSAKAVKYLKLPQTPLETGIRECFIWFLNNNFIKLK